jgi:hypothetical protein
LYIFPLVLSFILYSFPCLFISSVYILYLFSPFFIFAASLFLLLSWSIFLSFLLKKSRNCHYLNHQTSFPFPLPTNETTSNSIRSANFFCFFTNRQAETPNLTRPSARRVHWSCRNQEGISGTRNKRDRNRAGKFNGPSELHLEKWTLTVLWLYGTCLAAAIAS